jgi:two-component system, response regulator RegA
MKPKSILVIDDDQRFRERLAAALRERGPDVAAADSPDAALRLLSTTEVDAIVTDLKMPGVAGLAFIKQLCDEHPDATIVVLTGYGTIATAVEAMRLGVKDYMVKPCNADQVLAVLAGEEQAEPELSQQTPSLARLEREHIERVLVECGGNVSKAARVLGIHRRTLQYKLSKFPADR